MSAYGLARSLGTSSAQAKLLIEKYFALFPGIARFMEHQRHQTDTTGFVTTFSGRRISLIRNASIKGWMQRLALNAPMQGSASEIIKRAMIEIKPYTSSSFKLLLQVHDELVFEADPHIIPEIIPRLRYAMENAARLIVPLVVNIKSGPNWEHMQPC
jgi:DNA polymerase-1